MAKLIYVQLETCHDNSDGVAWYAYFEGTPSEDELESCFEDESKVRSEQLGRFDYGDLPEEVPSPLSVATGLKRYYVGGAA